MNKHHIALSGGINAGTDIGKHIHLGVSSESCTRGEHIEEKPNFDDLMKACEDVSKKGLVKHYIRKLNLSFNVMTIELFDKEGEILFCCSDRISGDLIKEYMELVSKQYVDNNPTFDDLINVVSQALKDRIEFGNVEFHQGGLNFENFHNDAIYPQDQYGIEKTISWIKSLYDETFVIEQESDISRVCSGADIELTNGNKCTFLNKDDMWRIKDDKGFSHNCGLLVLKGATVTQRKGVKQC